MMGKILLVLLMITLLGCSKQQDPLDFIKENGDNPVIQGIFNPDVKFKWHYDNDSYSDLKPLNQSCNDYYNSLSADAKELVRLGMLDEALGLALSSKLSNAEIITGVNGLDSYIDYFSGGAAYFLSASSNAKRYLESYDINASSYLKPKNSARYEYLVRKHVDVIETFKVCFSVFSILGIVGFDNIGKQTYESFAEQVSRASRQQLIEELSNY